MSKKFSIAVVLNGVDKASAVVVGAIRRIDKAASGVQKIGKAAGSVLSTIGKVGAVAGVAGAAVGKLVLDYADRASELHDLAAQLGLSVETLQELRYAATIAGTGVESLDAGMVVFSKNVGLARGGTGKLNALLSKFAPTVLEQVKAAKDNGEALDIMFRAMAAVEDPAKRAAIATAAFGGAGGDMTRMVADGTAALAKLRAEARETGLITQADADAADEFGDNVDRLKKSVMGVVNAIGARLLPILEPLILRARNWVVANRDLIATRVTAFIEKIGDGLKKVGAWFEAHGENLWAGMSRGADLVLEAVRLIGEHFDAVVTVSKTLVAIWGAGKLAGAISSTVSTARTLLGVFEAIGGSTVFTWLAKGAGIKTAAIGAFKWLASAAAAETATIGAALAGAAATGTLAVNEVLGFASRQEQAAGRAPTPTLFGEGGPPEAPRSRAELLGGISTPPSAPSNMSTRLRPGAAAVPQGAVHVQVDFSNVPKGVDVGAPTGRGVGITANVGVRSVGGVPAPGHGGGAGCAHCHAGGGK